jgi:hypothetical protein
VKFTKAVSFALIVGGNSGGNPMVYSFIELSRARVERWIPCANFKTYCKLEQY